jgi:hypothetical protein
MTSGVADSVEHAAAAVAAAAAEIRVIEDAHRRYSLLGRLAAFAWRLPWPRLVSLFATTLALVLAALWLNRGAIARAFDAYVTRHALTKLRGMLTPEVSARRVRLRWNTVSVEGLTIGNSPAANFANAPFLMKLQCAVVECDLLSLLGVRVLRGNFVVGWLTAAVKLIAIHGLVVHVDEAQDPDDAGALSKIRNFAGVFRAAAEAEAEAAAAEAAPEAAATDEEASKAAASKASKDEVSSPRGFFSDVGESFAAAQKAIDAKLAAAAAEAMNLPGNIASGITAAGTEVTNKLRALVTLLKRVNEPAPAETEESRLRNRQLTLDVRRVEFIDCAFHIPAVASSPFTFRAHMIDGFKGTTGELGKACADRLLKQIIAEFQRDVLATLTKPIAAVGDGLLSVGQAVGAGGGLLVDGVVGGANIVVDGVGKGANIVVDGVGKGANIVVDGVVDGATVVTRGLKETGDEMAQEFTETKDSVTGFFANPLLNTQSLFAARTYLVKEKYLGKVYDIVNVDDCGGIEIRAFMTALGDDDRVSKLLERGAVAAEGENAESARAAMAKAFAKLEKDSRKVVTKQEFVRYFVDPREKPKPT